MLKDLFAFHKFIRNHTESTQKEISSQTDQYLVNLTNYFFQCKDTVHMPNAENRICWHILGIY